MSAQWTPPRCEHGHLILGCPRDDCQQQNAYLSSINHRIDQLYAQQQHAARRIVRQLLGLPPHPGGVDE